MKKWTRVSDLDGTEIPEGTGALITIRPVDGRKKQRELDVTDAQAEELGSKGREVARRGRKPVAARA